MSCSYASLFFILIKPKKVLSIPGATFKPAHRRKTDKTYRGLIRYLIDTGCCPLSHTLSKCEN
jgi:hypothetical protein